MRDDWLPDNDDYLPDDNSTRRREEAEKPRPRADGREEQQPDYRCIRFLSNHCPYCGSAKYRTDHTQRSRGRVYRYHRCGECGRRFKSIENLEPKKGKK
ncbi:MAG TPA: hypothetical protein VM223_25415 [Planctomycetota bacterium]|nr:hypothetical protein [Planctomycetota bacterium]